MAQYFGNRQIRVVWCEERQVQPLGLLAGPSCFFSGLARPVGPRCGVGGLVSDQREVVDRGAVRPPQAHAARFLGRGRWRTNLRRGPVAPPHRQAGPGRGPSGQGARQLAAKGERNLTHLHHTRLGIRG